MALQLAGSFQRPPGPSKNYRKSLINEIEHTQEACMSNKSPSPIPDQEVYMSNESPSSIPDLEGASVPEFGHALPYTFARDLKADVLKAVDHQTTDVFAQLARMASDIRELTTILPMINELKLMVKDLRDTVVTMRKDLNTHPTESPIMQNSRSMSSEEMRWMASEVINAIRENILDDNHQANSVHQCRREIDDDDLSAMANQIFEKMAPFFKRATSLFEKIDADVGLVENTSESHRAAPLFDEFLNLTLVIPVGDSHPQTAVTPLRNSNIHSDFQVDGSFTTHSSVDELAWNASMLDTQTTHNQSSTWLAQLSTSDSQKQTTTPSKPTMLSSKKHRKKSNTNDEREKLLPRPSTTVPRFDIIARWANWILRIVWAWIKSEEGGIYLRWIRVFTLVSLVSITYIFLYRHNTADDYDHPIWTALHQSDSGVIDHTVGMAQRHFMM